MKSGAKGNFKRRKASNANAKGSTNRESKNGERIRVDQQLLPGIPDDLTVAKISPNFSWTVLNNLVGVSHGWLRLIQSRQLFEARKVCGREETAFAFRVDGRVHGNRSKHPLLALYSVEDCSVCYLPQIPCFTAGTMIRSFTYTSLDGKLYMITSFEEQARGRMVWRRCTYVYDLAGHIEWRKCADPEFVSSPTQSAVMNGKILVYDESHDIATLKLAIYDPDDDVWHPFKVCSEIARRQIEIIGGLQESYFWYFPLAPTCFHRSQWLNNLSTDNGITPCFHSGPHWMVTEGPKDYRGAAMTVLNGKFLKMTKHGLDIYDSHTNSWTPLHFESPELENLAAAGWRYTAEYLTKNPFKRTLDVTVVKNVVYSLDEFKSRAANHIEQKLGIRLWRREAVIRDSHQEMPLREKYASALSKLVILVGSSKCNEILKCPVQL